MNNNRLNFDYINSDLLSRASSLLPGWFPGGKWDQGDYKPINHVRGDRKPGSFVINTQGQRAGKWKDFAYPEIRGSCLLSLFAYREQLPGWNSTGTLWRDAMYEAAKRLGYGGEPKHDQYYHKKIIPKIANAKHSVKDEGSGEDKKRAEDVQRLWETALPVAGTIAETYFGSRKLPCPDEARFIESCYYGKIDTVIYRFPCILFAFQEWPSKGIVGVQRIFLSPDGKSKFTNMDEFKHLNPKEFPAKKSFGQIKGAAIRFKGDDDQKILAIGEGAETCLAFQKHMCRSVQRHISTWATGGSNNMDFVILPSSAKIIIIADHDNPGVEAAKKLQARLENEKRKFSIYLPPNPGEDANDMLIRELSN